MSKFSSFAFVGAGAIGKAIIAELVAQNATVTVVSRSADKALPGTRTAVADYSDVASITRALEGSEVVISGLGPEGLSLQPVVIDAAKAAGVKLFVLSEYGFPTDGYTDGLFGVKEKHAQHAASIGLPTARVYTGFFIQYLKFVTGVTENGKVNVVGDENTPGSVTAMSDIAGYIAYVLTNLPPSELQNKIFRIQGQKASMKEIAEALGTTVEKVDKMPGARSGPLSFLSSKYTSGAASSGWVEANKAETEAADESNRLWPGHKWLSLNDVLKA